MPFEINGQNIIARYGFNNYMTNYDRYKKILNKFQQNFTSINRQSNRRNIFSSYDIK